MVSSRTPVVLLSIMNHKTLRRFVVIISAIIFVVCGISLTALSVAHAEMMSSDDCMSFLAEATDCAQSPDHVLHVLANRAGLENFIGTSLLPDGGLLLKFLSVLGFGSVVLVVLSDLFSRYRLGRLLRFREFIDYFNLVRFRSWRITIQELHPLTHY